MKAPHTAYKRQGFTIVELAVTIAVIAILGTIIVASYRVVQTNARDSKRVADMVQLTKAMDTWMMRNDKTPEQSGTGYNATGFGWVHANDYALSLETLLIDARLLTGKTRDPLTPTGTGSYMFYGCSPTSGERYYAFMARVENPSDAQGNEYEKWTSMGCPGYASYEMNYARIILLRS